MSTEAPHPIVPTVSPQAPYHHLLRVSFWIRELPFALVLILTTIGVAYTSFSKTPITGYWEVLAPLIALVCVGAGWENANDKAKKFRLIATQALHWIAFIVVMNLLLLASVQRSFNASATGLAIFTLAGARHLYGGRACAVLAGLPARPRHGARHSGDRVDRKFGAAARAGRRRGRRHRRGVLVAHP